MSLWDYDFLYLSTSLKKKKLKFGRAKLLLEESFKSGFEF